MFQHFTLFQVFLFFETLGTHSSRLFFAACISPCHSFAVLIGLTVNPIREGEALGVLRPKSSNLQSGNQTRYNSVEKQTKNRHQNSHRTQQEAPSSQ